MTLNRSKKAASSQTARKRQRSEQEDPIEDTNRKRRNNTHHTELYFLFFAQNSIVMPSFELHFVTGFRFLHMFSFLVLAGILHRAVYSSQLT
jgi:DNA replication protein DnaD